MGGKVCKKNYEITNENQIICPNQILSMPPTVEEKIEKITGFKPYRNMKVELNKEKKKIDGIYFQYNKGCILYALLNEGWIDEKYVPDSLKYYKNHSYSQSQDKRTKENLLRKLMSVLDLGHLWTNMGGVSPYMEISIEEAKRRIYRVLSDYFFSNKEDELKKAFKMSFQNINYYELIGTIKVKYTLLKDIREVDENPSFKYAIDEKEITKGDIVVFGDHFLIYNGIVTEDGKKAYSFIDSLSWFYFREKDPLRDKCNIYENEGILNAFEDSPFINTKDSEEVKVGILEILKH